MISEKQIIFQTKKAGKARISQYFNFSLISLSKTLKNPEIKPKIYTWVNQED